MKIKLKDATNTQLDWLVGTIEHSIGFEYRPRTKKCYAYGGTRLLAVYSPTTIWAQGGPIIEREHIAISYDSEWVYDPNNVDPEDEPDNGDRWYAEVRSSSHNFIGGYGPTPLIAAMRCYVASKLGDEVEIPEELWP